MILKVEDWLESSYYSQIRQEKSARAKSYQNPSSLRSNSPKRTDQWGEGFSKKMLGFFFFFCHGQEMEEGVRGQARNILKGQGRRQCEDSCWGAVKDMFQRMWKWTLKQSQLFPSAHNERQQEPHEKQTNRWYVKHLPSFLQVVLSMLPILDSQEHKKGGRRSRKPS